MVTFLKHVSLCIFKKKIFIPAPTFCILSTVLLFSIVVRIHIYTRILLWRSTAGNEENK